MFRPRRVFQDISETLALVGGRLEEIRDTLQRMDARMDREFKLTRAALENNTRVTREILLELRDHRPILEHIDNGVHANTEGLLHVLDELRNGRGGPGTAPAA
jgi:hypothetical protein